MQPLEAEEELEQHRLTAWQQDKRAQSSRQKQDLQGVAQGRGGGFWACGEAGGVSSGQPMHISASQ
ncbi:hypothetical protein P7K49_001958, partial [Saguinus oedipus]